MIAPIEKSDDAAENAAALLALKDARSARSDPAAAETAVLRALQLAPQDLEVRLGAYRFYFYNHRYSDALPHAQFIVEHSARRLNIPVDWRAVSAADTDFSALESVPGLYLQALLAWGYCNVRLGELELGREAVAKAAEIDPSDRFGAQAILEIIDNGDDSDADEA